MNRALLEYFRCPEEFADLSLQGNLSEGAGYFRFGPNVICHGRASLSSRSEHPTAIREDCLDSVETENLTLKLPFDLSEVVDNLRLERYVGALNAGDQKIVAKAFIRDAYYLLRPYLPVFVRRHLQKIYLRGWRDIPFPAWPVDTTVDQLFANLLHLLLAIHSKIPFVWFWPEAYSSCAIMTHDVETVAGLNFCESLMDINDSFGVKSSFQLIPEGPRYAIPQGLPVSRMI